MWLFPCFPHSYFIAIASFSQSAVIRAYSGWNQYVHASANEFPVKWNMAHYTFHFYCTDKDNAHSLVIFWNLRFVLNLDICIFMIIQKWMKIKRISRLFLFLSRIKNNLFWYRTLYYYNCNFTNNNMCTSYLDYAQCVHTVSSQYLLINIIKFSLMKINYYNNNGISWLRVEFWSHFAIKKIEIHYIYIYMEM